MEERERLRRDEFHGERDFKERGISRREEILEGRNMIYSLRRQENDPKKNQIIESSRSVSAH